MVLYDLGVMNSLPKRTKLPSLERCSWPVKSNWGRSVPYALHRSAPAAERSKAAWCTTGFSSSAMATARPSESSTVSRAAGVWPAAGAARARRASAPRARHPYAFIAFVSRSRKVVSREPRVASLLLDDPRTLSFNNLVDFAVARSCRSGASFSSPGTEELREPDAETGQHVAPVE